MDSSSTRLLLRRCVMERVDDDGIRGVKIGKELMPVAERALKTHLYAFAPLVLPLSEKIIYAGHLINGKVIPAASAVPGLLSDARNCFQPATLTVKKLLSGIDTCAKSACMFVVSRSNRLQYHKPLAATAGLASVHH